LKKSRCGKNLLKVLFDREIKGKKYNRDSKPKRGKEDKNFKIGLANKNTRRKT